MSVPRLSYTGLDLLQALDGATNYNALLIDLILRSARGRQPMLDFGAGIGTFPRERSHEDGGRVPGPLTPGLSIQLAHNQRRRHAADVASADWVGAPRKDRSFHVRAALPNRSLEFGVLHAYRARVFFSVSIGERDPCGSGLRCSSFAPGNNQATYAR